MLLSLPLGLPFDSRISPAPAHVISDTILLSFNLRESKPISRFSKPANASVYESEIRISKALAETFHDVMQFAILCSPSVFRCAM